MPAAPGARVDDGALQLLRVGAFGRPGALGMMPLLLSGHHLRHPRVQLARFQRLRLTGAGPVPLAADGEPLAPAMHIEVRVRPAALGVVRL
jgi:diacylglycerol kinase family enzyme